MKEIVISKDTLEGSLYKAICLLTSILCAICVIINNFLSLDLFLNISLAFFSVIFGGLFYRFTKRDLTKRLFYLFVIALFTIYTVAWYFSNGLVGSMISMFGLLQVILLMIIRAKNLKYMSVGIIIYFSLLYAFQNTFKGVVVPYKSLVEQELDIFITTIISLVFGGLIIWKFKSAYEKERIQLKLSRDIEEQAKKEAERYNNLQSEFLANMSHEIRTPLNGIIGNSELLLHTQNQREQKEYIDAIVQSGQMLLSLINNVLDLSKLESNKLELNTSYFSINEILKQVEGVFVSEAHKKNIQLKFTSDKSVPASLIGDANQLKQILVNLISNALKFTHKGSVTIEVSATLEKNIVNLYVEITDTGVGISEEHQQHIFDRFYQVNQRLNREFQGSGLGLIICKNLIELMDGAIWVESELGKGSVFSFTVKLKEAKIIKPSSSSLSDFNFPALTILIAEDNEINQKLLQKQLLGFGFESVVVSNGEEALKSIEKEAFDLIFMDIQMPILDGIAATKGIRERSTINQPIIIALTANAMKDDRQACLEAGMNDYLSKPVSLQDMKETLVKWFYQK